MYKWPRQVIVQVGLKKDKKIILKHAVFHGSPTLALLVSYQKTEKIN